MSIRNKVIFSMMLLVLLICTAFFSMIYRQNQKTLQQMIDSKSAAASIVADSVLSQIRQQEQLRIKSFVNYADLETRERIIKAFAERRREELLRLSTPFWEDLKKENPYLASLSWVLPDNRLFLQVHDPLYVADEDTDLRSDTAAVNKERVQHSGFITGRKGPEFRVVQPLFYRNEYLGAVQLGVAARMVIESLESKLNLPAGFSIPAGQHRKASGETATGMICEANTVHSTDNEQFKGLLTDIDWTQKQIVSLNDQRYILRKVLSLDDFRGERLGCLFVAIDISEMTAALHQSLLSAILLSSLLLFLSYVILYYSFGSLIEKIYNLNLSLEGSNQELEDQVQKRTRELLQEIEERKEVEEKLNRAEKMEAIGLMASGVAHDLNNILSGVVSYPELLLMRLPEDSQMRQPLTSIKESGLRAAAVVADLLTVARNSAKIQVCENLNALVLEYLQSTEAEGLRVEHPGVVVSADLAPDLPKISCSSVHVNKCIMNLVLNAAEACTVAGEISISSGLCALPDAAFPDVLLPEGDYVFLAVADNGPGISGQDMGHIFEPFYTKKKMGRSGTGIGLTVVWNCMQDHGGSVSVQSDQQNGTVFTLFFPVGPDADCSVLTALKPQNIRGRGECILVVDDEPHQRDIATQILTELGYRVQAVGSGEEAIAYVKGHQVDLLLLDMLMEPGLDGGETFAEILKIYPEQKAIIVSGYSNTEQMEKVLALGAGAFLKKPYTLEQLGSAVGKILHGDE